MPALSAKKLATAIAPVLALLAVWAVMLYFANPQGAFPLNDDWNYARTVKSLVEEHKLTITQWSLAAALPHFLVGYIASVVGGFSFTTLRLSTLALGVGCSLLTYFLMRRNGAPVGWSLVASATLVANPLFFDLSTTFMTDVPFLAFAVPAIWLFCDLSRSEKQKAAWLSAATVLSVALCLFRQTAIVLPVAYLFCRLFDLRKKQEDGLKMVLLSAIPLFVSIVAVVIFQIWLNHTVGTLFSYIAEEARLRQLLASGPLLVSFEFFKNTFRAGVYLGLFMLPLLLVCYPAFLKKLDKGERFFAVGLMAELGLLVGGGLVFSNSLMPLADNVMFSGGLGPVLLRGLNALPTWPSLPKWVWVVVTLVGSLGFGALFSLLAVCLIRARKKLPVFTDRSEKRIAVFCLSAFLLYMAIIGVRAFFDRYLIFPMICLVLPIYLCTRIADRAPSTDGATGDAWRRPYNLAYAGAACSVLVLFAVFSSLAVHDLFEWNRLRWQVLNMMTQEKRVSPMDIDGGLEFNGWYSYDPLYRDRAVVFSTSMIHNDKYALSFDKMPGFDVIGVCHFNRWMPPGEGQFYLLQNQRRITGMQLRASGPPPKPEPPR